MEYRIQSTGELKTQGEVRRMHSNTSLPRVWDADTCAFLGIDPVLAAPKPEPSAAYKQVGRNGAVQDANGNWVEAYTETDMFADTTEDGVTTTKAEHEAAYQARLDADAASSVRSTRDAKLAETDWTQVADAPISQEDWAAYRALLRSIPEQEGFPNEVTWPVEPE
jgi:hypothetical protein